MLGSTPPPTSKEKLPLLPQQLLHVGLQGALNLGIVPGVAARRHVQRNHLPHLIATHQGTHAHGLVLLGLANVERHQFLLGLAVVHAQRRVAEGANVRGGVGAQHKAQHLDGRVQAAGRHLQTVVTPVQRAADPIARVLHAGRGMRLLLLVYHRHKASVAPVQQAAGVEIVLLLRVGEARTQFDDQLAHAASHLIQHQQRLQLSSVLHAVVAQAQPLLVFHVLQCSALVRQAQMAVQVELLAHSGAKLAHQHVSFKLHVVHVTADEHHLHPSARCCRGWIQLLLDRLRLLFFLLQMQQRMNHRICRRLFHRNPTGWERTLQLGLQRRRSALVAHRGAVSARQAERGSGEIARKLLLFTQHARKHHDDRGTV
eukprot:m.77392 g.77392  ORF g.77392 m.77392 type:complete len:371 (+) comp17284_c2_seq2:122-1234(+)